MNNYLSDVLANAGKLGSPTHTIRFNVGTEESPEQFIIKKYKEFKNPNPMTPETLLWIKGVLRNAIR